MAKKYGEYYIISEKEPANCIDDIFEGVRELLRLRQDIGGAIDGTTEIIIKPYTETKLRRNPMNCGMSGMITVAMTWMREEEEDGQTEPE